MAFNLIAYPNLIYTSTTEPADKTAGRLWSNTSTGGLYVSDGTNYNLIGGNNTIHEVYTGNGFDTTISSTGTIEGDHELTAIAAASLVGKTYVKIRIVGTARSQNKPPMLKIQKKEVGGAYADLFVYQYAAGSCVSTGMLNPLWVQFDYIHTLTAGDIANGIQLKLFSFSESIANTTNSFTNIQTIIELI